MPEGGSGEERRFTYEHPEHGELEVEAPDNFVPKDKVESDYVPKDSLDERLNRARAAAKKGLLSPEEAVENEEVFRRLLDKRKDELVDRLSAELSDDVDPDAIRERVEEELRATEIKPREEKLESLQEENSGLRQRALSAEIHEAADELGVDPELVPLIVPFVERHVGWSSDHRRHFVHSDGGEAEFEYSNRPAEKRDAPYKSVHEFLAEIKASGERQRWFLDESQDGAGYQGGEGGRQTITLEEFEKMGSQERRKLYDESPQTYHRLMQKKREKAEGELTGQA